jgi:hypothetical protein
VTDVVVDLIDDPAGVPRRTATLLTALLSRSAAVSMISGAQTLASIAAGLAALGRQMGTTVEGSRVRQALANSRAGHNLDLLFSELGFGDLVAVSSPTPVLEDLHNDLALLLAPDLGDAIESAQSGAVNGTAVAPVAPAQAVDPIDFLVGFWAYSRQVADSVEALVDWLAPTVPTVTAGVGPDEPTDGRLLR